MVSTAKEQCNGILMDYICSLALSQALSTTPLNGACGALSATPQNDAITRQWTWSNTGAIHNPMHWRPCALTWNRIRNKMVLCGTYHRIFARTGILLYLFCQGGQIFVHKYTHYFRRHVEKVDSVEKRESAGKSTRAQPPKKREIFHQERQWKACERHDCSQNCFGEARH